MGRSWHVDQNIQQRQLPHLAVSHYKQIGSQKKETTVQSSDPGASKTTAIQKIHHQVKNWEAKKQNSSHDDQQAKFKNYESQLDEIS